MTTSSNERARILEKIVDLVEKIQRNTKIGTAFEKYDTTYLWTLGQEIWSYSKVARNKDDAVAEILNYLNEYSTRCTPVLLKNAESSRRSWSSEVAYLQDVNDVSYGKLKAILPILDPDFISQTKLSVSDRKKLLEELNKVTYEEVLARVRKIRQIYDQTSLSIDIDQFYSDLHSMNNYLETAVMKRDSDTLSLIRTRYPPKLINDVRMLLTALRNEESFQKLEKKSPKEIKGLVCARDDSSAWFSNIVDVLVALRRGTSCSRDRTRQRIGVSKLGELSTLLKAASSDEELERYRRGRELLERIRNPSVA